MSPPPLRVQVVLAGTAVPASPRLGRFLEAMGAAAAQGRRLGVVGAVSVAVAASGDGPSLSAQEVAGHWQVACGPRSFDGLTYDHVGGSFSAAHNHLLEGSADELVLLADVDAWASPLLLAELVRAVGQAGVGIVDAHQLPLEDPKAFDPCSGDTSWASGTCLLARSEVLSALGGFDDRSFPSAGADVDLSWRARLAGWRVVHQPAARVFLGQRVTPEGSLVIGGPPGAGHDRALASLVMAWKYARPDVVEERLGALRHSVEEADRQAATSFLARRQRGELPTPLARASSVAELAATGYGPQRFEYRRVVCRPGHGPAGRPGARGPRPTGADLGRGGQGTEAEETGAASPRAGATFLSVLVRTQGRRLETLHDTLLSLGAQTAASFEVVVLGHDLDQAGMARVRELVSAFPPSFSRRTRVVPVEGGGRSRPLNVGVGLARGLYVVALDDDDVALGNWVETFRDVVERAPGLVARARVAFQGVAEAPWGDRVGYLTETGLSCPHPARFDLWEHLVDNQTPICAAAIPRRCFSELGLAYDEGLPVYEDWDLLLQAAIRVGVADAGEVTAVYRTWRTGARSTTSHTLSEWDAARQALIDKLDAAPLIVPPGSAGLVRSLQLAAARHAAEATALRCERDALRSERDALEVDRDRLAGQHEELRSRLGALEAEAQDARAQVVDLRRSTSWRVTGPLRALRSVTCAASPRSPLAPRSSRPWPSPVALRSARRMLRGLIRALRLRRG